MHKGWGFKLSLSFSLSCALSLSISLLSVSSRINSFIDTNAHTKTNKTNPHEPVSLRSPLGPGGIKLALDTLVDNVPMGKSDKDTLRDKASELLADPEGTHTHTHTHTL